MWPDVTVVAYFDLDWVQDPEFHKSVTSYFTLIVFEVTFWMSH